MSTSEIIKLLNVVDFDMSCPSGEATAPVTRAEGDQEVFRGPAMQVVHKHRLNPFLSIRVRAKKLCMSRGTAFCGAVAVSDEHLPFLLKELAAIQQQVDAMKVDLVAKWPGYVEEWIAEHPTAAEEIRAAAPTAAQIDASISTSVRVFKVSGQHRAMRKAGINDGLVEQIDQMGSQIANEIAQDVASSWRGYGVVTQKVRGVLARIRQKASSLIFVDSRLKNVVKLIDDVTAQLPNSGKIEGRDYLVLKGLFDVLGDPDALLAAQTSIELEAEPEVIEVKQQAGVVTKQITFDNDVSSDELPNLQLPFDIPPVVVTPVIAKKAWSF